MRGNRTNHPLKWARDADLKELKELFTSFVNNDFAHLTKRVSFQDVKVNFLLIGIGIILAMMGFLLTLLFKVI